MSTTSFPQSANGVVIIKEPENESTMKWGSGMLIGPDLVLTAAQNVYDGQKPTRKKYPYIKFIPRANGDETPFGEIEVQDVFASEKFISYERDEENYALLILKTPIGRETGYCGVRAISAKHSAELLKSAVISVVRYPAVERMKEGNEICFEQRRERRIIHNLEQKTGLIQYDIPVSLRQSGGTVFNEEKVGSLHRKFFVIGVHVGQDKDSSDLACMITKERFEELYHWINEIKREKFEKVTQSKDDKEGVIKKLQLIDKFLGPEELSLLTEYRLRGLEEIDLSYNVIKNEGIEFFCKNSVWENLKRINLERTSIGNDGCYSLSKNETWKQLKALHFERNDISADGVSAIFKSKIFLGLEGIDLNHTRFGPSGALALAGDTLSCTNLKKLDLEHNAIGDEGASAIGKNTS